MAEQTQAQTGTTSKPEGQRDLRQEITDRMVQSLEQGQIPWNRPWQNLEQGQPRNMVTGNAYKGGNRFILQMTQMDLGYADPRFGTVKQINELGGRVNKGEHGHPIELWKDQPFWQRPDVLISLNNRRVKVFGESRDGIDVGSINDKKPDVRIKPENLRVVHRGQAMSSWSSAHEILDRVVSKVYVVFNVEQCSGLKLEPLKAPENRILPIERGEKLMQTMQKDGVAFKQHAEAFYSPARDEIYLPLRESFKSQEGYYDTVLHEIGHATGAAQRLNRDGITGGHKFGSEGYAKEELRAELFSTFMAAETGIPHDEEQHKAYIQSWAKVLKEDKNEIFRAASEAGKAVDYVLNKERSLVMTQDHDMTESKIEQVDIRLTEPSLFWAKVENAAHMIERGQEHTDGLWKVEVGHQIKMTAEEYDKLTDNLLADNPHIAGMGGSYDDGTVRVAEVTAPDRQRLHIDPEGYNYPRYVGIPESEVDAFLARGSFRLDAEQQHAQGAECAPTGHEFGTAKDAGSTVAAVNPDGSVTVIAESRHVDLTSDKDQPEVKAVPGKPRATRKTKEAEMSR